ncbi:Uncharacterised protein [Vibrio cholerae]|uniref:Uncharacterized protein n=1 Tax=Vibrio cholerae TaxID=666 RepID=A0A655WKR7_VIBCL|nr:Uncharacterised protein [Vibrio cholerae]CSA12117.1 Uncharacterised protein [Vibrio cholerae]CSA14396.1 Uncharacterised protein [Vibrio cholerae]CSA87744.1 Uncharacterised protein [Vibrio cholerae]CSB30951.1 Uncharacterised protein [Vibrio cholerae]
MVIVTVAFATAATAFMIMVVIVVMTTATRLVDMAVSNLIFRRCAHGNHFYGESQ